MPQLNKRVVIAAPPDKVWAVLADFGNVARWAPTVAESHLTSSSSIGVGAERELTTSTGHVVQEMIVAWYQGHGYTFENSGGQGGLVPALRETWTVGAAAAGCVVAVDLRYKLRPGLLGALLDRLTTRRVLTKMLVLNLAGLKHHVETGEQLLSPTQGAAPLQAAT